jgi:hypothetical protein
MDSQLQSSSFTPDQYQELFTSLSGYQNKHWFVYANYNTPIKR